MASPSSIISRAFILTLISLAALFAFSEPPLPVLAAQTHWTSSDGVVTAAALTTDCSAACNVRCGRTRRPNLCRRACRTCCGRCNCVPPGTSGNENMCPCYASLTTQGGKRKCP